jgi:histone H3/H4
MISQLRNFATNKIEGEKMNSKKIDREEEEEDNCFSSVDTEEDTTFLDVESNTSSTKKRKIDKKGHEKRHNFCIQKSVFRNILKEILKGRSISEEAVEILHSTCENHMIDIFSKTKKVVEQANRKTMTDEDLKLVISLIK